MLNIINYGLRYGLQGYRAKSGELREDVGSPVTFLLPPVPYSAPSFDCLGFSFRLICWHQKNMLLSFLNGFLLTFVVFVVFLTVSCGSYARAVFTRQVWGCPFQERSAHLLRRNLGPGACGSRYSAVSALSEAQPTR